MKNPKQRFMSLLGLCLFTYLQFDVTGLGAQSAPAGSVILVSDTQKQAANASQVTDRVTLVDGTVLVGKISEMSVTRVVMKVSGTDYVVDPGRIAKVERNVVVDPLADRQRPVLVSTKDGSKYRGYVRKADATVTLLATEAGEIPIRNDNIQNLEYLDAEQVRQQDAIAARPPKWELSVKGGSMFYQLGTMNDLFSPGYFGLLQAEYPQFLLPFGLRIAPGLQAGYVRNAGKSLSSTKIDLFPGHISATLSYQIASLPLDVFAGGLFGVSLTRGISAAANERLSLDLSYGAELGVKYFLNTTINFRLSGIWLAVSESNATLNHIGAYAAVGFML